MSHSIDPQLLYEQSGWLHRLATQLVGDLHRREDLLQETWLTSLEDPPRAGDERSLRAWLARVLRNRALHERRGGSRREYRERAVARHEATPSATDSLERAELHRELMNAVLSLEPAQRDLILLRYLDGLPPREIAKQLGQSDDAVRSRLARALHALREKLDRERDGDRRAWSLAFLVHLVENGGELSTGAVVMKTQTKIVITLLLLTGVLATVGGLAVNGDSDAALAPELLEAPAAKSPPLAAVVGMPVEPATAGAPTSTRASAAAGPTAGALDPIEIEGRVTDVAGDPVPGIGVRFETWEPGDPDYQPAGEPWTATTDANGVFLMPFPETHGRLRTSSEEWVVLLDEYLEAEPPTRELHIFVAPRRDYAGRVTDSQGRPVSGSWLIARMQPGFLAGLRPGVQRGSSPLWKATSDDQGGFELPGIGWTEGLSLQARTLGFQDLEVPLPDRDESNLTLVLQRSSTTSGELAGLVLDATGQGVERAWVYLGEETSRCDAQGKFIVPWDGEAGELMALGRGYLPGYLDLPAGVGGSVVVLLDTPALTIRGRVVDAQGQSFAGVPVWTWDGSAVPTVENHGPQRMIEEVIGSSLGKTDTDSEGRFELDGRLARSYWLHAMHPETLEVVSVEVEAGSEVELVLAGQDPLRRVAGRVLSFSGEPVAGARLGYGRRGIGEHPDRRTPYDYNRAGHADDQGQFEFEALVVQGTYFQVSGLETGFRWFVLDESEDLENLELRVPLSCSVQILLEQDPGEADRVRLLDGEGEPVICFVSHGNTGQGGGTAVGTSGGTARITDGKSEVLMADESVTTLVLLKDGEEVRRVEVELTPGEVDLLRL